jgi:cytochrome c553
MKIKPLTQRLAVNLAVSVASLFGLANTAFAQADAGKDALYVKSLAATCANCHGTNGKSVDGSTVPSLAGLGKAYHIEQMKAFKAGTRPATIMHQLSKGYSDAQIETLAGYFATQKK